MNKTKQAKRIGKCIFYVLLGLLGTILCLALLGNVALATGLIDETINVNNEYSRYPLMNYQLDFYVDSSWSWLPWNWGEGIGDSVMYGLYAITNFLWIISLYLSSATGYVVKEVYSLDFISQMATSVGGNMQTLAGVNENGFTTSGFYVGFLLLLIFILGIYITWVGLIKRETTKAVSAGIHFVVIFLVTASFIAYAPAYITRINDFSRDISNASLDLGTRMVMPDSNIEGRDSVDSIRDILFSIQIKQPWLLLQYGTTNIEHIGAERVELLESTSPNEENGETREDIVREEIETYDNMNLSVSMVMQRLGITFFLFLFNIIISVFVFILSGISLFTQVSFIIYAMFLVINFILSMFPTFHGKAQKAVLKLFNVIMKRAGVTLIITVAFSISAMFYTISVNTPFFFVMFLQIVTFVGIFFMLGELLNTFSLQSDESAGIGKRFMRAPMMFNRQVKRAGRGVGRIFSRNQGNKQRGAGGGEKPTLQSNKNTSHGERVRQDGKQAKQRSSERGYDGFADKNDIDISGHEKNSVGARAGRMVGNVLDTKGKVVGKVQEAKDKIKSAPTNAKYTVYKGKEKAVQSATDFKDSMHETKAGNQAMREGKRRQRRESLAQKRHKMSRGNKNTERDEVRNKISDEVQRANKSRERSVNRNNTHEQGGKSSERSMNQNNTREQGGKSSERSMNQNNTRERGDKSSERSVSRNDIHKQGDKR